MVTVPFRFQFQDCSVQPSGVCGGESLAGASPPRPFKDNSVGPRVFACRIKFATARPRIQRVNGIDNTTWRQPKICWPATTDAQFFEGPRG